MKDTRPVQDSMGTLNVPTDALYGAQTQRAINNFPMSGRALPPSFIHALALVKQACAQANFELGLLDLTKTQALSSAVEAILKGEHDAQFPVDIFQTGSGTSTNMNMNEVLATLASRISQQTIHPNDDVNMSQSSNDVIPSAIHVSAMLAVTQQLLPNLQHLSNTLERKAQAVEGIIKTGRTHLMDAMPISLSQEIRAWRQQIIDNISRLSSSLERVRLLPQGATAVGTGINADPKFAEIFCQKISELTHIDFKPMPNLFIGLSSQDTALELSGQLNVLGASLMKIANDLRWMNAGPLAGLGEIQLPALQPGSSIMPGKVNPVIPESVAMVCAQISGNHTAITIGAQSGNFQLNVMLPMIADNLLYSINIAANAAKQLADQAIAGFVVNQAQLKKALDVNPILVTALNTVVGYEKGAAIAKEAYRSQRPVLEVALEMTDLDRDTLIRYLDPAKLTQGGTPTL
ncbi:class II fumarate hydratase [Thiomicrospira microaerophila]|uniref:class II fumarate hydratase n=1 Tax=Thiomicrospira microaerophila TaxID=406020 RepID=UPI0005C9FBC5|nr:class II fumarate hydratase [Thiomicrospira microaerophila]